MNESQLEQIVTAWGMDILRFCRITTGSRDEDDELYQDTMLTLLEKLEQLDPAQNIKSYAISVALKLWSNRRGKWLRRLRLVPQDSLEALAETGTLSGTEAGASPEELLLRRAQIAAVRRSVQQLPEKYRLPIELFYSADLSISAIAQVLNLPENTVKSRLRRGREMIRKKLEEREHD